MSKINWNPNININRNLLDLLSKFLGVLMFGFFTSFLLDYVIELALFSSPIGVPNINLFYIIFPAVSLFFLFWIINTEGNYVWIKFFKGLKFVFAGIFVFSVLFFIIVLISSLLAPEKELFYGEGAAVTILLGIISGIVSLVFGFIYKWIDNREKAKWPRWSLFMYLLIFITMFVFVYLVI